MLTGALPYCEATGGSLDISIGRLTELWNFSSGEHRVPSQDDIARALDSSGLQNITVSGDEVTLSDGCKIDLGAVAKEMCIRDRRSALPFSAFPVPGQ